MAFLSSALLGAALAVTTVQPADPSQPMKAVVTHADLDLSSASGRDMLGRRVKEAVRIVCDRPIGGVGDFHKMMACQRRATAEAAPQIQFALDQRSGRAIAIRF